MTNPTNTNRTFSTRLPGPTGDINTTNSLPAGATPNPFGNSLQFVEVAYLDQLNQLPPPAVQVGAFMPAPTTISNDGLTVELWFKAESSGSLVSVPMSNGQAPAAVAPLMYIDSNGLLRAGLFDSTQITLIPGQNLIAQNNNGLINVGAPNTLASPLSVVDSQWHHAALVVQPGSGATQSLYLDGRLAASSKANGSFGLTFAASDGTTWTADTPADAQFGGSITPQPVAAPPFQPYAQGFCGCINELRTWYGPRSAGEIQQLIDIPLLDQATYQSEGLAGYVGQAYFSEIPTTAYLGTTTDAPPVDPFTDVTNRVSGYQNYGICTAIPFTTVALDIEFQPSQPYSTKISLCQTDQLQVSFPSTDANGDNLTGTFSMTLTSGVTGQVQTVSQIIPNTVLTITAELQDCYRFNFTYSEAATIDHLQFMLIPGPLNTLMQLLLDVEPGQTAYTDPNFPTTPTTIPDPRPQFAGKTVTLPPYWPLFTDETVFPIGSSSYTADDLLSAYLYFNEAAQTVPPPSNATFSDFFNLAANGSTIYEISDLTTLLGSAYQAVVHNPPPAAVPTAPFTNANDQMYAFIYNANAMRKTLNEFLTTYQGWAQLIIDDLNLNLAATPGGIATKIYADQQNIDVSLKGPSTGAFIINLIVGSAIIGLGAMCPLAIPAEAAAAGAAQAAAATVSTSTVAATFLGGAGANALSEFLGTFLNSDSVQSKLGNVSYSTLQDVATNVSMDIATAYTTLLQHMLNPAYLQTLYSNYGLLQALSYVNAQPLYDGNQSAIIPGANNSLTVGTIYASWKALIPSVFTWSPQLLNGKQLNDDNMVFMVTNFAEPYTLPYGTIPSSLGVQAVLQTDPWDAFYWMLHKLQDWQTGTESSPSGGQFFSACPIFYMLDLSPHQELEFAADWVIAWSLIDANNRGISSDLVSALFGMGNPNIKLSLADQNNPIAAAGYGWYCNIANGAVTTPFDAFMNWGEGVPAYSTHILPAQLPNGNNLYQAKVSWVPDGLVSVPFAAAAAADVPPPALVTLEPSSLDFGSVAVGTQAKLSVVLTNNQQNALQNITCAAPNFTFMTVSSSELDPGESETMTVDFLPRTPGPQSGAITFTAQGQYGPITLTLQCTGMGV